MDWYRRTLVILLPVLVIGFSIVYITTLRKWGFYYIDTILVKSEAGGSVVYSGEVHDKETVFTVTGNTVSLTVDGKDAGTYTYVEDHSVIMESMKDETGVTGIVIYKDGKEFLTATRDRFGLWHPGDDETAAMMPSETKGSAEGNDPAHPTAMTIYTLVKGPVLTHRGNGQFWLIGTVLSIVFIITVIFAQELFDLCMMLVIKDYYSSEPTNLELVGRYVYWTVGLIVIVTVYVIGLALS